MQARFLFQAFFFLLLGLTLLDLTGCGQEDPAGSKAAKQAVSAADTDCNIAENWCVEHGVPENICAQCNAKVAADFQQKGDWCKEHNRPESQCFLCNPKLKARLAAEYEAKHGKKPPASKTK
jgi:hypothetical protein